MPPELFAAAARKRGNEELASMFEGIAAVELQEHFAELAGLAGLVGADADHIRAAVQAERVEVEWTYPRLADQARGAGDFEVAERFAEIAEDEREHEISLEQALERVAVLV
jgi:rubrerythrin